MTDATQPAANNWPGPQATNGKPTPRQTTRMDIVHRIAELQGRYRTRQVGSKVRLADMEKSGELLPAEYADEATARAGLRLHVAYDVEALFETERAALTDAYDFIRDAQPHKDSVIFPEWKRLFHKVAAALGKGLS